ncbi:MAG: class I SAM-dependent methyltransferase [Lentisphaeria bacterium]|nr:class I SAM-dependent methyltransferase [Lentisphaeria bacterium]
MTRNAWNFWARYYDRLWVQRFVLKPTRREILKHISPTKPTSVLDVGCGTGQLYADLCRHFNSVPFSYLGIDPSERMLQKAREKHPDANFKHVSADTFTASDESHDIIACCNAFPYFDDQPGFLARSKSMLSDDGSLLIAQASVNSLYDALVMMCVKVTVPRARYCSRREVAAMGAPVFGGPPQAIRINRSPLIPSIILFKWQRAEGS